MGCSSAFASYEPHHDRSYNGQTVRYKDTTKAPGTSRVTPVETPKPRNTRPAATHIINQARRRSVGRGFLETVSRTISSAIGCYMAEPGWLGDIEIEIEVVEAALSLPGLGQTPP